MIPHEQLPPRPESFESRGSARRDARELWRLASVRTVRSLTSVRRLVTLAGLVLAWCALWGSFSAANVLSGVVAGVVVLLVGAGGSGRGGIRVVPLLRFIGLVTVDMITSTATVIREVLTPTDHTEEGIVGVDLPAGAEHHLLLLFVAITVTPGTAVVAADSDGTRVYLHVLHCDRRAQIEAHVHEIAHLAVEALPVSHGVAGDGHRTHGPGRHGGAS